MGSNRQDNSWIVTFMAFLVACGLWLYVMNEQNPFTSRTFVVQLGKANLPADMIVSDMPETVKVRITGPRAAVASTGDNTVTAYVDFSGAAKGRSLYNVQGKTAVGEVTEVSPSLLQLAVDTIGERVMEVEPRIMGVPNSGVTVGKMNLQPTKVDIKGASGRIAEVGKVVVLVDVSNKEKNFEDEAALVAINKDGTEMYDVSVSPSKVHVSAVVLKQLATNNFPIQADLTGVLPVGFVIDSVTISPQTVKLTAEPGVLSDITTIKTAPVVLDKLSGDLEMQMPLSIPEKVLADTHNVMVNIKLKKVE